MLPAFLAEYRIIGPSGTDDAKDRLLSLYIGGSGKVPSTLVDAGEPLSVHGAHHIRAGTCASYRHSGIVKARV